MKKRVLWTPDEHLEAARAAYESKFGKQHQSVEDKAAKPKPVLLPKPERIQVRKGEGVSIAKLREAQKAERRRKRFNKAVKKNLARKSKALVEAWKEQVRAAKALYRASLKEQRAKAEAALKAAEAAKAQAEALWKQVEAMRKWLELEKARQRALSSAAKERIRKARACGFRLLSTFCSQEQWGASCPLQGHIRGLAAAAAVIWAAENK
jgi:hypothetical protein